MSGVQQIKFQLAKIKFSVYLSEILFHVTCAEWLEL